MSSCTWHIKKLLFLTTNNIIWQLQFSYFPLGDNTRLHTVKGFCTQINSIQCKSKIHSHCQLNVYFWSLYIRWCRGVVIRLMFNSLFDNYDIIKCLPYSLWYSCNCTNKGIEDSMRWYEMKQERPRINIRSHTEHGPRPWLTDHSRQP